MTDRHFRRPVLLLASILIFTMACSLFSRTSTQPTAPSASVAPTTVSNLTEQPTTPVESTINAPTTVAPQAKDIYPSGFATYPDIQVNFPAQFDNQMSLPIDPSKLTDFKSLKLTDAQLALLSKNGFVIAPTDPGSYNEFYQVYESLRYDDADQPVPNFVTTDSVYHVYHLIFDKMLRDLERDSFIPTLNSLTSSMLSESQTQLTNLTGTPLEEPARRNVAFFAVAAQLLNLPDAVPADVKPMVDAELKLINDHSGASISPIWDRADLPEDQKLIEDYGQYVPRGHYTRSEELKQYFKAMMWYGRLTFRLKDTFETQRALLLVQAIRSAKSSDGTAAETQWADIYDPTAFIVGKSDDLSYHEYGKLMDDVFGPDAQPASFSTEQGLKPFMDAAKNLPAPQINSMWVWIWQDRKEATQGLRFMGQRFTLDEYVFGQLIWRNVGTLEQPRSLPKGLDVFAAMGSNEALSILDTEGETKYDNYSTQMTKVQGQIAKLGLDSWTQNLYWSWLYSFQPLISVKDQRFPAFMQTQAWTRKELNTALGSWTELKHDTILYAKQVMAEMGGGDVVLPKGYVEPNPEAYARLLALDEMTEQGLQQRGILSDVTKGNLENLAGMLTFLKTSSETELAGGQLSTDDYNRIRYIGGEMEALTLAASDREGNTPDFRDLSDQKAALVADVATGPSNNGGLVALEEAIGQPSLIYVVLPDQPFRVAIGAVYSYYEFTVDTSKRMTDEEWQAQVAQGSAPALPDWTQTFTSR